LLSGDDLADLGGFGLFRGGNLCGSGRFSFGK